MRTVCVLLGLLFSHYAVADQFPESITVESLDKPADSWVLIRRFGGPGMIFDAATAEMKGLVSLTDYTPAVTVDPRRAELYAAESYYSRLHRGTRTDVLTIYDMKTLSVEAEVKLPTKVAALIFLEYVGLIDNRFVGVFNMTPAASVSIVDAKTRKFVEEISGF